MKTETIINSYYGGIKFIETRISENLCIFIIDDDEFYSSILKQQLEFDNKNTVLTFHTGEASFDYLDLNPDLVIIDYHLDGTFKAAKKGDEIAKTIQEYCPNAQIILVSQDNKISLLKKIAETKVKIHYKHGSATNKILNSTKKLISRKRKTNSVKVFAMACVFLISLVFIFSRV